ncbi:MAG: YggT family protein [Actinobacteria bacterium]|nr:YggT family protein [Actinomycetota bacterium]
MIGTLIGYAIWLYLMVLTARAVLSFVPLLIRDWQPRGVVLVIAEIVYTLTDPPLRLLRKVLPPVQLGGAQLDLGFLVLFMLLSIAMRIVPAML